MALELTATVRQQLGRHAVNRLRREDKIPAVIYREGKPGTNLTLERRDWVKILSSGQRVVTLKIEGGDKQALIKDVQYDVLGDGTLHVDFNELREGQKVRVAISLVIKGTPKGHVKGGVLNQAVHTLHVECLPTQIPDRIVIDAEPLDVDDVIHVKEVKLPDGVHAVDDPNQVVIAVHMPRTDEASAAAEAGPAEPEVLTAKKEDAPAAGAKPGDKKEEKKDDKKK